MGSKEAQGKDSIDLSNGYEPKQLDADLLKELRDNVRVFQKLDLTYLATAGAIAAGMKISNHTLIDFTSQAFPLIVSFLLLSFADTFTDIALFRRWVSARTSIASIGYSKSILKYIEYQPFLHLIFISYMIVIFFGLSAGFVAGTREVNNIMSSRAFFQNKVDEFIYREGKPPGSPTELLKYFPQSKKLVELTTVEAISIDKTTGNEYILCFADDDNKLGTDDDFVLPSNVKLEVILARVARENNQK